MCAREVRAGKSAGSGGFGGEGFTEDEEFDKGKDEDYDGQLAEEETLGKGEAWGLY